jgi:hypothetical protein
MPSDPAKLPSDPASPTPHPEAQDRSFFGPIPCRSKSLIFEDISRTSPSNPDPALDPAQFVEIAAWYVENESGTKLARPELFRLLADAQPGDLLLVEQVDRLSRLTAADWERLKAELTSRRVRALSRWTCQRRG